MVKLFSFIQTVLSIFMIGVMVLAWGLPLIPAFISYDWMTDLYTGTNSSVTLFIKAMACAFGFLIWGISLLILSGSLQFLLHLRFSSRLEAPLASLTTIRWAICGQLHRATMPFLRHAVPSFLGNTYYRLAGCKIGQNVNINSCRLNDPSLIVIGSNAVIGGEAVINGHLVEQGKIVLEKVVIGERALIGGGAFVGPGAKIGNRSTLASRSVLPKRREVPDNAVWGGIPARSIREEIE